jgi:hypothetical protein
MPAANAQNENVPAANAPHNIIVGEPPRVEKPKATGEIGLNNVTWHTSPDGVPRAQYKADVEYPGLRFEAGKAFAQTDWSGAGALALDVKNPGSEAIEIYIRVDDNEAADGNRHSRTGGVRLAPGERADVLLCWMPPRPVCAVARHFRAASALPHQHLRRRRAKQQHRIVPDIHAESR